MPRIPLDWLRQHVDVPADLSAEELAAALVKVGLEEETIHRSEVTGPIVVGKVLTLEKNEQSNGKLINYCRVDVGVHNDAPGEGKEPSELPSRGIICGAHNFVEGDYVVVSLPGAVLPGDFKIAARKTYGHISDGMICSQRELGLGNDHDGIIVLAHNDDEARERGIPAIGSDVLGFLGLNDEVLEINITPDRGYCFSMRGVAREYSHSTGAQFTDPALESAAAKNVPAVNNEGFAVEIADDAPIHGVPGCSRFVTRIVRGIDASAQSPQWMQDRLTAAGMRPISLVVDATNYVMLDLGQPLHAYDLNKTVAPLIVRRAKAGEILRTLDGAPRTLGDEDLVIADSHGGRGARAVGLAGTMGGASTEISDQTTDVLIEAAHFDSVSVARMARNHRLPSEASKRFERGVDPQLPPIAAQAVVDLLVEYGGGTADQANFEVNNIAPIPALAFNTRETRRLTGLEISAKKQIAVLQAIGCEVEEIPSIAGESGEGDTELSVTPPAWRPDLVGAAHFVEEIARLVGFDEIASVVPYAPAGHGLGVAQRQARDVARALAEQGWVQVLSYPFVSGQVFDQQGIVDDDARRLAIRLQNPLQESAPYMRTSILDSLLETAKLNVARGHSTVAVFETGLVTHAQGIVPAVNPGVGKRPSDAELGALDDAIPTQPRHIAGVATARATEPAADLAAITWDWRDAIEAVKTLGRTIGVELQVKQAQYAPFHPGRCAQICVGETVIGYAGELAPQVCKAFDLPQRAIAFEADLDALFAARGNAPIQVAPVSTFPMAKEDIAIVVDEDLPAQEVEKVMKQVGGEILEDVRLFDVYRGDQIGEGKKSLAFALRLRGLDHTLTAEETAALRKRIVKQLKKAFNAELRG
ncbi:phenylalanyl-tRNA synthetase beta chain [Arcanobacterium pluranimalium]|uniref:phenylalanine--tRNA ligase subunit beta n=1 Tax=Arcanobacterium pluranimalium TaxID=108028 RepID=UPI001959BB96|nr:phenylalanine--tRNA ligase subunit beta [Arcanobacterium pluranimalium]MBM7825306.1 phenylalanyl-tRNA synthetase beta chain [Arcanobacterium pluranimalium]